MVAPLLFPERVSQNAYASFLAGWEEDFAPRVKRKPSVWAKETRRIASGTGVTSDEDAPYDHAIMPHCEEIMDAADDPTINEIVMWLGIREGKTNGVCMNLLGRIVTDDPGNVCSVHPIDDDADRFSQGDVEPTIEACLEGYFVEKKSRDTGRTINFKKFKGGWLRIFSAGSASKFRGTTVKLMMLHELDALDPEAIFKAMGRSTGISDALVVKESTGTLAAEIEEKTGKKIYRSRIEEAYDQGDKRKWFGGCVKCGYLQTSKYEQLKYPPGNMRATRYHCEACDHPHTPKEWRKMFGGKKYGGNAQWYPTAGLTAAEEADIANNYHRANPISPNVRSYWRNGFSSLLPHHRSYASKLHEFVAQGEAAQTSKEAKMIWTQEKKAELWNPESEGEAPPAWKPIYDARESYGLTVPQGGLFLTAFTDVQKYRLEVGWRAWGRNEESWGMDHVVIEGYVGDRETWNGLRRELSRRWKHDSKAEIRLGFGFVDGGKWPDQVYAFFRDLAMNPIPGLTGKVRASKGFGQHGHPIVTRKMMTVGKVLKGHHIGTWEAKDRIYERLRMTPEPVNPDPVAAKTYVDSRDGITHFNQRFGEEYFQQLTVEQVTVTFEKGQEIRKYVNPKNLRNEALDIEVGNLAAFRIYPRNIEMLEQTLLEAAKELELANAAPIHPQARGGQPRATTDEFTGRGWKL